jgi:hypothetical protein
MPESGKKIIGIFIPGMPPGLLYIHCHRKPAGVKLFFDRDMYKIISLRP